MVQGAATPMQLAEGAGGRLQKARARDLLRKHYGLGVGPPPPLTGPGKPLDPMDIGELRPEWKLTYFDGYVPSDSPAFDAKSYYEQLITTASLSTLLKKENELVSGTIA